MLRGVIQHCGTRVGVLGGGVQGSQATRRLGKFGETEICHPDRQRAGNIGKITVIREIAEISVGLG